MIKKLIKRILYNKGTDKATKDLWGREEYYYVNDYDVRNLNYHIEKISEILDINIPEIHLIPYMADFEGGNHLSRHFISEIPVECYIWGRYYEDKNKIFVVTYDPPTKQLLHESVILLNLCHELRHVWQYTYHKKEYYGKPNAIGAAESIHDNAEIDADAFAISYMNEKTNYNSIEYSIQYKLYSFYDKGKRKYRARIIKNKYF